MDEGLYEIIIDEIQDKQVLVNLVQDELKKLSDDKKERELYLNLRKFELYDYISLGKSLLDFKGDKFIDEKIDSINKKIYERSEILKEHRSEYFESLEFLTEFYKNPLLRSRIVIETCIVENDLTEENDAILNLINFTIRKNDELNYLSFLSETFFENTNMQRELISETTTYNLNSLDLIRDLFWNMMIKTDASLTESFIYMGKESDINLDNIPFLKFLTDDNYASKMMNLYLKEIYPALESFDIISRNELKKQFNLEYNL